MYIDELQAAVLIAIAACPDVRFIQTSASSIAFRFQRKEGMQLFLNGITFYPRLYPIVVDTEVVVTYLD